MKAIKTNFSVNFEDWYIDFRHEISKKFGVRHCVDFVNWELCEDYRFYYDKGLTPKEALENYFSNISK